MRKQTGITRYVTADGDAIDYVAVSDKVALKDWEGADLPEATHVYIANDFIGQISTRVGRNAVRD
jgi:dUTPase